MMSLAAIRSANLKATAKKRHPYVPSDTDLGDWPPFPFPDIGDYEPSGWKRTEHRWFVDSSGMGEDHEAALTTDQFKRELREYIEEHPGYGFGIVEVGQFQVYVASFRPIQ
jgi:hypothetical protein